MVRPLYPGNIGSVARAMKNMGFSKLTLVNPPDYRCSEAYQMAYGADDILERARVVGTLSGAVAKARFVVGTTVRARKGRIPFVPLPGLSPRILSAAARQKVAVVFGSERTGLTNEELERCHELLVIPMAVQFPSLNLAQAAVVVLYELFKGLGPTVVSSERSPSRRVLSQRVLAPAGELERLYADLESLLTEIRFIKGPQGRFIMTSLRRIFNRSGLNSREVRIIRGVFRQVRWAKRRTPS